MEEALPLFRQVLEALEYVHAQTIVHRDVKPSNVMVCGNRAKLADFGVALLAEMPRITTSRQLIGSPPYMSPEQLEGKRVDTRSDIYSAALVLYRMLAGRAPFGAKEYLAQVHERLAGPPDLRTLVPELPAGLCDAIRIALRYDPDERFRSVAAFRDALSEGEVGFLGVAPPAADDESTLVRPLPSEPVQVGPEPEPRKATAIVALVIIGAFVAVFSVFIGQLDRQEFPTKAPAQVVATAPNPPPIILEAPTAPVSQRQQQQQPAERTLEPEKTGPFASKDREPVEDEAAKRERDIAASRAEIRERLSRAHNALAEERFGAAIDDLDHAAALARPYPDALRQERADIAELRERVIDAQVVVRTREAENARWESQLAEIEEHLRVGEWPEAERFAKNIANDLRAPDPIATRARALLEQAKEGRRNAFRDVQLGPTSNTIRKPSSPPRKNQ